MVNRPEKENVIVTGNNGFLGRTLTNRLRADYQLIGFDSDGQPQPPKEIECICCDLRDSESVQRALDRTAYAYGNEIASVIHLAAYYDFSGEPSKLYNEVTVEGTRRLLRGLKDFNVGQFIFSSTMLVHEPTEPGKPLTEEAPLAPKWDYPRSKADTEQVIREEHGAIPALLFRIAGVYTDDCGSIPLSQQMRRIYEDRVTSHVYPGDLESGQAFVHLDDVVEAVKLAVDKREEFTDVEALLIGEPETVGYGRLQKEFGRLLRDDEEWTTEQIPKSVAKSGAWIQDRIPGIDEPFIKPWMVDLADDHYELDITKARQMLGWSPKHRLLDALPKMADALRADPEAWYERHGFDPEEARKVHAAAHISAGA